jgi:hypothetical protein
MFPREVTLSKAVHIHVTMVSIPHIHMQSFKPNGKLYSHAIVAPNAKTI